jgi:hypothetical protein
LWREGRAPPLAPPPERSHDPAFESEEAMITAIVQFPLPAGTTRTDAEALFRKSAPLYQGKPGLVRKYYLYGEGPTGGGVYLWESRAAAEQTYTAEWRKMIAERYGAEPKISYFDSPVIVDNGPSK